MSGCTSKASGCTGNASQLRHRITLKRYVTTADDYGGQAVTTSVIAIVWAALMPVGKPKIYADRELQGVVDYKIRIRYQTFSDSLVKAVAVFGARTFDILAAINVGERGEWIDLMCRESKAQGTFS